MADLIDIQAQHNTSVTLFADLGTFMSFLIFLSVIFTTIVEYHNRIDKLPIAIFLILIFASLTNDYHFTKEF